MEAIGLSILRSYKTAILHRGIWGSKRLPLLYSRLETANSTMIPYPPQQWQAALQHLHSPKHRSPGYLFNIHPIIRPGHLPKAREEAPHFPLPLILFL